MTDITYIRTHEGWLSLAVVVDLFSRKVIGWSMQPRMTKEIVLNALLMALWRRNTPVAVVIALPAHQRVIIRPGHDPAVLGKFTVRLAVHVDNLDTVKRLRSRTAGVGDADAGGAGGITFNDKLIRY